MAIILCLRGCLDRRAPVPAHLHHAACCAPTHVRAVVPFFKVTERYTLDGDVSQPRRDLRPGRQQAAAEATPDGGLEVQLSWGEPNRGSIHEAYRVQGSSLVCLSTVAVAAGSVTTRTVYHRSSSWQPRFRWNPFGLGGIAQ